MSLGAASVEMRVLFTPKFRKRTAVGALFYVCQVIPFFALGTLSPQIMEALGVHSKIGAGATYNAFLLVGAVIGLLIIDRISRRTFLIASFALGAAFLAALVAFAGTNPIVAVILFAAFWSWGQQSNSNSPTRLSFSPPTCGPPGSGSPPQPAASAP